MFANLTGRGTSIVQVWGTFGVPKKVQLCDRLLLSSIFVFMKTLLLEAPTRIPQVPSKAAVNARIETQRARGKRHPHHFASELVAIFFFGKYASKRSLNKVQEASLALSSTASRGEHIYVGSL